MAKPKKWGRNEWTRSTRRSCTALMLPAKHSFPTQRTPTRSDSEFVDYRGVIHVHTFLGGHSTGTFSELIAAAKANHLDFVIMTEHPQPDFDTSAVTLSGAHAGVLFVNGNEVTT